MVVYTRVCISWVYNGGIYPGVSPGCTTVGMYGVYSLRYTTVGMYGVYSLRYTTGIPLCYP